MLTLVTGAPGSGKTLWTMQEVEQLRKQTGRPVYYNGIAGVQLSEWKELSLAQLKATREVQGEEGKFVHDIPQGAIVVVDEVYRIWPQGKPGEKLPHDIEAFAVHRHQGLDFYLLVQDRQRLHHFVRGLVGRHVHFERQFGLQRSRRMEWQKLGDPKDPWSKKEAAGSEFVFPKEVYGWYKSADVHTVKKRLPWARLALIPILLVVICAAGWFAVSRLTADRAVGEGAAAGLVAAAPAVVLTPDEMRAAAAQAWAAQWLERVKGQPHSASFYDPTLRPAAMPKISGCIELKTDSRYSCKCNTQQGTIITTMTVRECRFYLANGWFDPTRPDQDDDEERAAERGRVLPGIAGEGLLPGAAAADSGAAAAPPVPSFGG